MSEIENGGLGLYCTAHSKRNHLMTLGFKGLTTFTDNNNNNSTVKDKGNVVCYREVIHRDVQFTSSTRGALRKVLISRRGQQSLQQTDRFHNAANTRCTRACYLTALLQDVALKSEIQNYTKFPKSYGKQSSIEKN